MMFTCCPSARDTSSSAAAIAAEVEHEGARSLPRQLPQCRLYLAAGAVLALAGLLVPLGGGKMMAGSLAGLAAAHPEAPLGALLAALTPPMLLLAGAVEGAIFIAALALAFSLTLRSRGAD